MKTRTLLLLSVGTALAILLAGGVLLAQLAGGDDAVEGSRVGEAVSVGDAAITVDGARGTADRFGVDVTVAGVADGLDGIALPTGDETLAPLEAAEPGRCTELTVAPRSCRLDFDTSGAVGSTRVLVVVRGEDRASWALEG